jgi:hypothetical protein
MPATDEKDNPGIVEKTRRFASRRSDEKRRLKHVSCRDGGMFATIRARTE